MNRLPLVLVLALLACACSPKPSFSHGANERQEATANNPVSPPSKNVERILESLSAPRQCGEIVQPLNNAECDVQRIYTCLMDAFRACDAAHGVHMYAGPEGDAVRVDYFVIPTNGICEYVYVEDKSADPLNKEDVTEVACKRVKWTMHQTLHGCEVVEPSECAPRKIGGG